MNTKWDILDTRNYFRIIKHMMKAEKKGKRSCVIFFEIRPNVSKRLENVDHVSISFTKISW